MESCRAEGRAEVEEERRVAALRLEEVRWWLLWQMKERKMGSGEWEAWSLFVCQFE